MLVLDGHVGRVPHDVDNLATGGYAVDLVLQRHNLDYVRAIGGVEAELALDHGVYQVLVVGLWKVRDIDLLVVQGVLEVGKHILGLQRHLDKACLRESDKKYAVWVWAGADGKDFFGHLGLEHLVAGL